MNASMKFIPRLSEERGHADHGWLKTFHTFSFAAYHDPGGQHEKFGCLRVINEDRVEPRTGFGKHPHREFEIFSYIVDGQLEHKDSMGNTEILNRGDIQLTSAGTGITHSEQTYGSQPVHFLQIWSIPSTPRLAPKYYTRHFPNESKQDKWARVVAPFDGGGENRAEDVEGEGGQGQGQQPAPVHSPLTLYASLMSPRVKLERSLEGKKGYVHVVQRSGYNEGKATGASIKISSSSSSGSEEEEDEETLREGDGAYVFVGQRGNVLEVENVGDRVAEVLVFDID